MVLERVYAAAPPGAALIESSREDSVAIDASDVILDRTASGAENGGVGGHGT